MRTDRCDKTNDRFLQFYERYYKQHYELSISVLTGMRAKLKCLTLPEEECAEFDVGVQHDCSSRINLVKNFMKKKLHFSFFTERNEE
jgi:hypothetical protein